MIAKARRNAILLLVGVFLVGGVTGLMMEEVVDDLDWPGFHADRDHDRDRPSQGRDPLDDDADEEFLERLGLSPEQHRAVDHLLDSREDRLEAYWAGKLPEIEAQIDSTRQEIRRLLTADQQHAYDQWVARQRTPTLKP